MKRTVSLIVLYMIIVLLGCNEEGEKTQIIRRFYENAQITGQFLTLSVGNRTIINYHFNDPGEENVSDSQFSEDIFITLPREFTTLLEINNETLSSIQFNYKQSCFCAPIDTTEVNEIDITLERNGNSIRINGEVSFRAGFFNGEEASNIFWLDEEIKNLSGTYSLQTIE